MKARLTCTGSDALKSSISCDINGNILIATVNLNTSPSTPNSSTLTVKFGNIINPRSTKPTDEIGVRIRNANGFEIGASIAGTGAFVVVGIPAAITNATITPLDYRQ